MEQTNQKQLMEIYSQLQFILSALKYVIYFFGAPFIIAGWILSRFVPRSH